jgi:hypothetical protein
VHPHRSFGIALFACSLLSIPVSAARLDVTNPPGGSTTCDSTETGFTLLDFTPLGNGGLNLATGIQIGAYTMGMTVVPPNCLPLTEFGDVYQVGQVPGFPATSPDPTFEAGQSFTLEVNNPSATWGIYSNSNVSPEMNGAGCPGDSDVFAFFASCTDFSNGTTFTLSSSYVPGPSNNFITGAMFYTSPGALESLTTTGPNGQPVVLYGPATPEPRIWFLLVAVFAGLIARNWYVRRSVRC